MVVPLAAYDREKAVAYAHLWAYGRNPRYADYQDYGGDCTNFASQVLFAGCGAMNVPDWYYHDTVKRSHSWTGVVELYRFLVNNAGVGPFAVEVGPEDAAPGDIAQLRFSAADRYRHSPVIVEVGAPGDLDQILVAAHTFDIDNRPISSYTVYEVRFLHILGARK